MDAKEKAKELVDLFYNAKTVETRYRDIFAAKACAIICVDEILDFTINNCCEHQNRKYWEEVKSEIQNL